MANFSVTFHGASGHTAAEVKALFYKLHREIAAGGGALSLSGTVSDGQEAHQITNPSTAELAAIDAADVAAQPAVASSSSPSDPTAST